MAPARLTSSLSRIPLTAESCADGGENILAGADGQDNVLIGGMDGYNSLYGGAGGKDTLVGRAGSEDSFYFGAGCGKDTIQGYGEEDTVELLDGTFAGTKMDEEGRLKVLFQDAQGETSRLSFDQDMRDMVMTYEIGGEEHGAKFGASLTITDDTCDFINFYQNEEKEAGQLLLSGADDKATGSWLPKESS